MASVPKSQYDDLQKRHENMRKSREREQRRATKLEEEVKVLSAQLIECRKAALLEAAATIRRNHGWRTAVIVCDIAEELRRMAEGEK